MTMVERQMEHFKSDGFTIHENEYAGERPFGVGTTKGDFDVSGHGPTMTAAAEDALRRFNASPPATERSEGGWY